MQIVFLKQYFDIYWKLISSEKENMKRLENLVQIFLMIKRILNLCI